MIDLLYGSALLSLDMKIYYVVLEIVYISIVINQNKYLTNFMMISQQNSYSMPCRGPFVIWLDQNLFLQTFPDFPSSMYTPCKKICEYNDFNKMNLL